ncbi:hypothetical protein [Variovorax sp. LjRoot175]|uniref:hypothetical protein n=1 Tax=Variovorax sp. LjRoot175 TaxID=3342276 RepID=UPI003F510BBB
MRLGEAGPGEIAVEQLSDRAFCYLRCALGELVLLSVGTDNRLGGTLRLGSRRPRCTSSAPTDRTVRSEGLAT